MTHGNIKLLENNLFEFNPKKLKKWNLTLNLNITLKFSGLYSERVKFPIVGLLFLKILLGLNLTEYNPFLRKLGL